MPEKIKGKKTAKKAANQKPTRKPVKRKVLTKKSPPVKKAAKKKAAKKKALKKKASKKPARRTAVKKTGRQAMPLVSAIEITVEPGPPPRPLPPLEEPARNEAAIGTVTHYYGHLSVALVQINTGELKSGDTIRIKGHSTDIVQIVESMEYEHQHVDRASAGQVVGIKVKDPVREHDIVYRVG